MHRRTNYHMPSTTNTLESMHGHFNKRTPRKNTFFSGILRIHKELNIKYNQISDRIAFFSIPLCLYLFQSIYP